MEENSGNGVKANISYDIGLVEGQLEGVNKELKRLDYDLKSHMDKEEEDRKRLIYLIAGLYFLIIPANLDYIPLAIEFFRTFL